MKKQILLAGSVFFLSLTAFAQQKNFTISGKIAGLEGKPFMIAIKDASAPKGFFRDSIIVNKDGSFSYSMDVKEMMYMNLWPGTKKVMKEVKGGGYYPVKSAQLQFIAAPNTKVHFAGKVTDFVDAYPSGNAANNDMAKLNKQIYPLMNQSVNMQLKIANKEVTDSIAIKKLKEQMEQLDEKVLAIKKQFLKKNTASPAAAWLLADMMVRTQLSNDEAIAAFKNLNEEKLVATPFYQEAAKRVDGLSATAVGKQVPDIASSNTYDKNKFDLAALRNKYVVIDFWGTWCGPCISGMPKMKEYLDKYNGKLEIVGVAQESDNGEGWRAFLDKNKKYQWHHVLSRPNEDYILKFSVAGFPTKIIVDPQGKIVGRYVGESEDFYAKLDELIK